ncbi:MAG: hypothetical protein FWE42_09695 [Defluviitaleaceae bacterium]|nr:hypothetical protein [Defluviitaleaceae bacterium]
MPFPLTHLLVADELLTRKPRKMEDGAQFLLGSISPDAVHHRKDLPTDMAGIGPLKKITHLCPVSDERWGQVTDNKGWIACAKDFLNKHPGDPFAEGYAIHVLVDLYNNMTLWNNFRTNHPHEAADGYKSGYYQDLKNIDLRLYQSLPQVSRIWSLLADAKVCEIPGLVGSEEMQSIQNGILHNDYKPPLPTPNQDYTFLTYEEKLTWIQKAADFVESVLPHGG